MAKLTINIAALTANYKTLQEKVGASCEVAAVIKANAYGLGVGPVSEALQNAGCKTFFAATLPEAMEARLILGAAPTIAMLNGYLPDNASLYRENNITPVLNDPAQITAYKTLGQGLPAIIHVDTAMNRLGVKPNDLTADLLDGLDIKFLMSHFASSEDKTSKTNAKQFARFCEVADKFPHMKKSICNSSGIFLNDSYCGDLVRPGMALYGLNPTPYAQNPMQPVVSLQAEILQVQTAEKEQTTGYNETYCFDKDACIATVDIGYADGIFRSLSNNGALYWRGIPCPIRGRVSMDLTVVDLSNIPKNDRPKSGDMMEVIGKHQTADDLAKDAGTIGYEILTSLSRRYERAYI